MRTQYFNDSFRILCVVLLIVIPAFSSASVTLTYEYNALDRLSVATYGTSFIETYTYDPTGNRTNLAVSTGGQQQQQQKSLTSSTKSTVSSTSTKTASLAPAVTDTATITGE